MGLFKFKTFWFKVKLAVLFLGASSISIAAPALEEALIYKNAEIDSVQVSKASSHQVVLSATKRINNEPFIEKEEQVEGEKKILLSKLGSNDSINDAFAHYQAFIEANGVVAFSCEKRGCGISSYWANSILDDRRLSGRDSDQYYVSGKIEFEGGQYWVSVYLVTNALRQNMVHVSYIRHEKNEHEWENAYFLPGDNKLPASLVQTLKKRLSEDQQLRLFVAAYSKPDSLKSLSTHKAELDAEYQKLKSRLKETLAIPDERINYHFVGPFHSEPFSGQPIWFRLFLLKT